MKIDKRSFVLLAVFVIALYVLLPQLSKFHASIKYLSHPNYYFLVLGLVFSLVTYLEAALSYVLLAFKRIVYLSEVLIQSASMFINNLLPAGIGGLGANFAYLKHAKHSNAQATTVVAANNTLGLLGHLILFVGVVIFSPWKSDVSTHASSSFSLGLKIFLLILVLVFLYGFIFKRDKLTSFLEDIKHQIGSYKKRPVKLVLVLLVQMSITACNVLALFMCSKSVGINLALYQYLIIFTVGASVKNATPTPGGIGGYEAGLVAGFAAFQVPAALALAAVLFFRLVNFWLPLVMGAVSFVVADRKKMFTS